jgi:acetyltransferase-like isoleucine patch superfamily enzyme
MLLPFIKCLWAANRRSTSSIYWIFFKILKGSYFGDIGRGTQFFGRVRFGSVEGNILLGCNCWIGHDVFFSASRGAYIRLNEHCSLNTGCHIVAVNGIEIGSGTRIGEYCSIRDQNHNFDDPAHPIYDQGFNGQRIIIGKDVWLGRGVFVGPGVVIGDGCVIGANSVVVRDMPPYSVAVGSPARVIRKRGEPNSSNENRGSV